MVITGIGWMIIPLGLLLFTIFSQKWIYSLMVFFIPFSATAIINIPSGTSGFGIQVTLYFGLLLILMEILKTLYFKRVQIPNNSIQTILILLIIYIACTIFSIIMPYLIDGKLLIISARLYESTFIPLKFGLNNISTSIYLIYGALILILVSKYNSKYSFFLFSLKVYIISGVFVSLWGFLQLVLFYFDIPYPSIIFNNSVNEAAQGFSAVTNGIRRISSVATEPSLLSKYLLTVIPILLFAIIGKKPIFSLTIDRVYLLIIGSLLLLSTSSTGYIGLVILVPLTLMFLYILKKVRVRYFIYIILLIVAMLTLFFINPTVNSFINKELLEKTDSYSGLERARSIKYAWSYFKEYPILGVGWGSVTSHDLFVKILSNSGIVGLVTFVSLVFYVLKYTITCVRKNWREKEVFHVTGVLVSFFICIITDAISGYSYTYSHFWFIFGMVISSSVVFKNNNNLLCKEVSR